MSEDLTARQPPRKKKTRKQPARPKLGPDNIGRTPANEKKINELFAVVFRGKASDDLLDYLRSITTNQVMAPGTPPDVITYHEGARWLMGVIEKRIRLGQEKK